jgi:hypothetical protein
MNMKKLLPVLFLVILSVITVGIKRCGNRAPTKANREEASSTKKERRSSATRKVDDTKRSNNKETGLDRKASELFFTKHAKCRMKCRYITQQEVREILEEGTVNYNKSNLNDPKGPTYALEGNTDDGQHVRIIFAPKQRHISVVTVIDLENEYACNCN